MPNLIPAETIEQRIFLIRGHRVMIDRHLAELYGVTTMALNQAVKRNRERFPEDFMFRLTRAERDEVITICDNLRPLKFSPVPPNAFTENGVAMLSSVLRSKRAILVNIDSDHEDVHAAAPTDLDPQGACPEDRESGTTN